MVIQFTFTNFIYCKYKNVPKKGMKEMSVLPDTAKWSNFQIDGIPSGEYSGIERTARFIYCSRSAGKLHSHLNTYYMQYILKSAKISIKSSSHQCVHSIDLLTNIFNFFFLLLTSIVVPYSFPFIGPWFLGLIMFVCII